MKLLRSCSLSLALATLAAHAVTADHTNKSADKPAANAPAKPAGKLEKLTEKDAAWAAKARAAYPLKVCLTSDEKLGSMGDNAEFVYRAPGQPDRLVVFCCEGCEDDFKKAPAKYLAKLDAAAKKKPATK